MTELSKAINDWNAQTVAQEYDLSNEKSALIIRNYSDRDAFEKKLKRFEREYNATRKDAVSTLVKWAITDEKNNGIDQKIWNENNRLTGVDA